MKRETAKDLLGMMVDTAIKFKLGRTTKVGDMVAYCIYCGDEAKTPPEVRHKHRCLVARAKEILK